MSALQEALKKAYDAGFNDGLKGKSMQEYNPNKYGFGDFLFDAIAAIGTHGLYLAVKALPAGDSKEDKLAESELKKMLNERYKSGHHDGTIERLAKRY